MLVEAAEVPLKPTGTCQCGLVVYARTRLQMTWGKEGLPGKILRPVASRALGRGRKHLGFRGLSNWGHRMPGLPRVAAFLPLAQCGQKPQLFCLLSQKQGCRNCRSFTRHSLATWKEFQIQKSLERLLLTQFNQLGSEAQGVIQNDFVSSIPEEGAQPRNCRNKVYPPSVGCHKWPAV